MSDEQQRWWCLACLRFTEKAPCEHCDAGHEDVLVIEAGRTPPRTVDEADAGDFGCVLDHDYDESCFEAASDA